MPRARLVSNDAVRFGAIVNRLRVARGWTLVDFARETGMNGTYLGVLERGENMPNLATVLKLARVFGMEAAELVRQLERSATHLDGGDRAR
jgi:transcriptional regulator with XRE-family HTH domain